jgi:hypothetical protein
MKTPAVKGRKYGTTYKKKILTTDAYLAKGSQGAAVCEGCQAVYRNKRWYVGPEIIKAGTVAVKVVCPACLKIRDNFPGGIVTLSGDYVLPHKMELMKLVKNEEDRARGFNPLERVMTVKENGHGSVIITTTNEKLAQRLGRAIKKAFHGDVKYHWSHDNKLVRVDWVREVA